MPEWEVGPDPLTNNKLGTWSVDCARPQLRMPQDQEATFLGLAPFTTHTTPQECHITITTAEDEPGVRTLPPTCGQLP